MHAHGLNSLWSCKHTRHITESVEVLFVITKLCCSSFHPPACNMKFSWRSALPALSWQGLLFFFFFLLCYTSVTLAQFHCIWMTELSFFLNERRCRHELIWWNTAEAAFLITFYRSVHDRLAKRGQHVLTALFPEHSAVRSAVTSEQEEFPGRGSHWVLWLPPAVQTKAG